MIGHITALYALTAATLVAAGQNELVQCTPGEYKIIGKADCTGYYLCVFGNPVEMPPCPSGSVFSSSSNVCVNKGSIYDDCKKTTDGSGSHVTESPDQGMSPLIQIIFAFQGILAQRNDVTYMVACSPTPRNVKPFTIVVFVTHRYPDYMNSTLLNAVTPSCLTQRPNNVTILRMSNVEPGRSSRMAVSQYKYKVCGGSHCMPCNERLPSCVDKGDGITIHPGRLWTPFYVVCYKERTIKTDRCKPDVDGAQFFHPEKNECVSLDMIPREHGGMMPECGTKVDGFYLDDFGRCDRYVHCQRGKYIGTIKCAVGEVFDDTRGGCVPEEKACGPCGKLDHW
ncbi:hypothetical protein MAR_012822 [Mya arenaria]|uniref:Chitin-binding type-2 domain-containing protein n=1 Tax=Mya arenaria TaxID=6604 RepID=A0ABY7FY42_MYAAR|nr:hypothetical protein MAR_012822 [Mya arenaria]